MCHAYIRGLTVDSDKRKHDFFKSCLHLKLIWELKYCGIICLPGYCFTKYIKFLNYIQQNFRIQTAFFKQTKNQPSLKQWHWLSVFILPTILHKYTLRHTSVTLKYLTNIQNRTIFKLEYFMNISRSTNCIIQYITYVTNGTIYWLTVNILPTHEIRQMANSNLKPNTCQR